MSTIKSRLAVVERQLRWQRAVIAGLLVALVALVGYGATKGVPDVIRSREFVVVNDKGKPVLVLKPTNDGGAIASLNEQGYPIFALGPNNRKAGSLLLASWTYPSLASVEIHGQAPQGGGGSIVVKNGLGKEVVRISSSEQGKGFVGVFDSQGKGRTLTPK
jgi:hypothetical protein